MANTIINGGASPYPKHVGPAAICSFSDGAQDAPLQSLKFNIEPSQDLHGYDYPWPGGGGKNLINFPDIAQTTEKGVTYSMSGGILSINGTATASLGLIPTQFAKESATYTISAQLLSGSMSGVNNSFSVYSTGGARRICPFGNSGVSVKVTFTGDIVAENANVIINSGAVFNNAKIAFQVEAGSDMTAFAPYSNISPISGWSQVDAAETGWNLWDEEWEVGTINTSTGQNQSYSSYFRSKNYIPVKGGQAIYINAQTNDSFYVWYYAADKSYIRCYSVPVSHIFTPPANAAYIRFVDLSRNNYNDDVCVNYSDASFNGRYVPYSGTPITIALGQTVYGGYVDALRGKLVIDRVGVAITNANEIGANHYAPIWRINYNAAASTAKAPASTSVTNIMCNAFKAVGEVNRGQPGTCFISGASKWIQFDFSDTGIADTNAAKTYFLSLNPFIVYELATPIEVDLTPVSVSSLLGQNNIWCNTGDTELDYYPAAASVVAVLNKSSKVYTSIPLGKIRYDTYQTTPNQALDLDSYRAETGVLIRNVLSHTATKIEFNTPSMTNLQWEEVWNIIKAGFNNSTERKLKLKYYDQMSATYKTGWFYVPDVQFTIRNIDEANGIINYDEVRVAFIEY